MRPVRAGTARTAATFGADAAVGVRMLVVWCPDWPVVAAVPEPAAPVAVVAANRVIACSAQARADGVRRGMRRRDAQGQCPGLIVLADDPLRDARAFEPVACAVEDLAAGVEVVRPGLVAVPARGPVGYFGGPAVAAEHLVDHVATVVGVECQVGIADGLFAAVLAAYRAQLVEPGHTVDFLAPLGVIELTRLRDTDERMQLVDLLRRLGIRTLGAFAELAERDVATRFGAAAVDAHRLARGIEERPPVRRKPPAQLSVSQSFDPPVDRVDAAAFAARGLAARLHDVLSAHGVACARLAVHAITETGQQRVRLWRSADPLTPDDIADRVRWQLEGWLRGGGPAEGISLLRVEPVETVDGGALQLGLLQAGLDENSERAARAMVRVQGLLGAEAVCIPMLGGGRGPDERVRLVPWGDERTPAAAADPPWPGRLPAPSPTLLARTPARVLDAADTPVFVTDSGELSAPPARLVVRGDRADDIVGWAGPWPVDERWWDGPGVRCDRMQAVLAGGRALLLACAAGIWSVTGSYD